MRYRIIHSTELEYESNVGLCYNEARLFPRELPWQKVLSSELKVEPHPASYSERRDYFGNRTAFFIIQTPHEQQEVTVTSVVETFSQGGLAGEQMAWEEVRALLGENRGSDLMIAKEFTLDSPKIVHDLGLVDYAAPSFTPGRPLLEAVQDLMQRIYHEFTYDPEFSTIATPLRDVLKHRSGVCQDFAHLAIGCLRSHGLAARYVSGYIETQPPPGAEKLVGADASHAWFSVFLPGVGWFDFDPTNNTMPAERHITVAWGRDFSDVTPLKGVAYGGGEHELKVSVDVEAVTEQVR